MVLQLVVNETRLFPLQAGGEMNIIVKILPAQLKSWRSYQGVLGFVPLGEPLAIII